MCQYINGLQSITTALSPLMILNIWPNLPDLGQSSSVSNHLLTTHKSTNPPWIKENENVVCISINSKLLGQAVTVIIEQHLDINAACLHHSHD